MEQYFISQIDKNNLTEKEYKKQLAVINKNVKILRQENGLSYKKKFTQKEKVLWAKALQNGNNPYYEYYINTIIAPAVASIQVVTYKDAVERFNRMNLFDLFGIKEIGLGKNFPCGVIPGNVANINCDKEGVWRYFTRDKSSSIRYVFDAIDMVEIVHNVGYYEALKLLCEWTKIEVEGEKWIINQHVKYSRNNGKIHNADEDMAVRYPILYKYIRRHLYVLKELNVIGSANLLTEDDSVEGEAVFFTASRYMADKLEKQGIKKSHTNINKLINMFTVLGLIKKIPIEKVPEKLKGKARGFERVKARDVVKYNIDGNKNCHTISFFCIPLMTTEFLMEAQRRAMLLKQAKIKATGVQVTDENLKQILGEKIYYSTIGNNELFAKRIEQAKIEAEKDKASLPF